MNGILWTRTFRYFLGFLGSILMDWKMEQMEQMEHRQMAQHQDPQHRNDHSSESIPATPSPQPELVMTRSFQLVPPPMSHCIGPPARPVDKADYKCQFNYKNSGFASRKTGGSKSGWFI